MVALCWLSCYWCDIGFASLNMCSQIHVPV